MNTENELAISRANRARAIVEDPLINEALTAIKNAVVQQFFATPIEDARARELLHMMERARKLFEDTFRTMIAAGDVAKYEEIAERETAAAVRSIQDKVRTR